MARRALLPWFTFALLCIIWGSTWIVIKWGLEGVPTFLGASYRFGLGAAILFPLALLQGHRVRPTRAEALLIIFVGLVLFGADYGFIYWAEGLIDSGLTAVLFATMPFLTALMARPLLGEVFTRRRVLGIGVGFAGVAFLFLDTLGTTWGRLAAGNLALLIPMAAVVLSSGCAAISGVMVKKGGQTLHAIPFNAWAMLVGSGVQLVAAVALGEALGPPSLPRGLLSVLYLALAGSVVGFIGYFYLLKSMEATQVSLITMVTPVVALLVGFAFGEGIGALEAMGAALILSGVLLSTRSPRLPTAPPEAVAASASQGGTSLGRGR